ncbi:MAG: hypothetical protein LC754_06410 [Acidobacteria bacterium]|nr:hypothetical protein [Acidobacteriota bacterium]
MNRVLKSVIGGVSIVIFLYAAITAFDWFLVRQGAEHPFIERNPAGWLLEWPLPFLKAIFPPDVGAMVKLSFAGLTAAALLDILVYSTLVYVILRWRAGRKRLP